MVDEPLYASESGAAGMSGSRELGGDMWSQSGEADSGERSQTRKRLRGDGGIESRMKSISCLAARFSGVPAS